MICGEGLAPPEITVKLKPCGEILKEQLKLIETRFPSVTVEDHVIMPDHIHAVIFLHGKAGGASPSPTLDDVICAFKSLTSRICKQKYGIEKMFRRSSCTSVLEEITRKAPTKCYQMASTILVGAVFLSRLVTEAGKSVAFAMSD